MRRPEFIARQGRCPSGWLGRAVASITASETSRENAVALDLLDPQPGDHVLEIGFGHGRVIAELARRCPNGRVQGLDTSATMVEMASRYNQSAIASGAVDLDLGTSSALPYASATFDRVLSVHTIYFWSEPLDHLREIVRVLKPSGRFVLGYKPDSEQFRNSFPDSVYAFRSVDQITALLGTAGLRLHSQVSPAPASRGVAFSIASAPVPENPGEILSSTNGSS